MLIAAIHPAIVLIRLKYGQLSMSGHSIFFKQDLFNFTRSLPNVDTPIVIVSKLRSDGKIQHMRARRGMVKDALLYLKQHNPYYAHILIDEDALHKIPTDGFGQPLAFLEDTNETNNNNIQNYGMQSNELNSAVLNSNSNK